MKRREQPAVEPSVELVRRDHIDPRRLRRVAELLADILNNRDNPDEGEARRDP